MPKLVKRIAYKTMMNNKFKVSAYLLILSAFLGVINVLLSPDLSMLEEYLISLIVFCIIIGFAILVYKKVLWIKYVLLILVILGIFNIPYLINDLKYYPINGIINISQSLVQLCAVVILFLPKNTELEDNKH